MVTFACLCLPCYLHSRYNFNKERATTNFGMPYDYCSIMHYGPYAFSNNRRMAVITRNQVVATCDLFTKGQWHKFLLLLAWYMELPHFIIFAGRIFNHSFSSFPRTFNFPSGPRNTWLTPMSESWTSCMVAPSIAPPTPTAKNLATRTTSANASARSHVRNGLARRGSAPAIVRGSKTFWATDSRLGTMAMASLRAPVVEEQVYKRLKWMNISTNFGWMN